MKPKLPDVKVVDASPKDTREIQEIFYKTWLATYPSKKYGVTVDDIEDKFKDAFTKKTLKIRSEKIQNPPKGQRLITAKKNKKIIGLCRLAVSENENRLKAIYILPEYQRKGVGKMLWEEAKKDFDSSKNIIVTVAIYNKNAISFYKKLGFVDTGKRRMEENLKMKSGSIIPEMDMILKIKQN